MKKILYVLMIGLFTLTTTSLLAQSSNTPKTKSSKVDKKAPVSKNSKTRALPKKQRVAKIQQRNNPASRRNKNSKPKPKKKN